MLAERVAEASAITAFRDRIARHEQSCRHCASHATAKWCPRGKALFEASCAWCRRRAVCVEHGDELICVACADLAEKAVCSGCGEHRYATRFRDGDVCRTCAPLFR
ncbi:hypothetical protein B4N89_44825 [Embleya scabrispora]|uniref:Uncharacterized protein n=1 Tax=Embleya scabrispora TaxID=159449 RepID=A0A1T3NIF4_9ACTN|nr:hypothetical protein B4N89_44825 [Embleya scabrispora]